METLLAVAQAREIPVPQSPSEPLRQVEVDQTNSKKKFLRLSVVSRARQELQTSWVSLDLAVVLPFFTDTNTPYRMKDNHAMWVSGAWQVLTRFELMSMLSVTALRIIVPPLSLADPTLVAQSS